MIPLQPGQPIQFSEVEEVTAAPDVVALSVSDTIGKTLRAYRHASRQLVEGKYAATKKILRRRTSERLATSSLSDAATEYW